MRKRFFNYGLVLILFSIVLVSTLTLAADKDIVKTQGVVMEVDLKKNTMIINERRFTWDQNTAVNNDKRSPISIEKVKARSWVYVEGVEDKVNRRVVAKKIYLLPRYIDGKEKQAYSFMQ